MSTSKLISADLLFLGELTGLKSFFNWGLPKLSDFLWLLYYLGGESALKATLSNNVISGFSYSIRGVTILAGFLSCQFKYDIKPLSTIPSYAALSMTNSTFFVTIIYILASFSPETYLVLTLFGPILDQSKLYLTQRCFQSVFLFFFFSNFVCVLTKFWQLWFHVSSIESLVLFWLNFYLLKHLIIDLCLISLSDWRVPLHWPHACCLNWSHQ